MSTAIFIPARLNSSRFPNKVLAELNGKPMIRYIWEKCRETGYDTYVISEDRKILNFCPTPKQTQPYDSGTERICKTGFYDPTLNYTKYINVQGDMPDINLDIIKAVEDKLDEYEVSTAYTTMPENLREDPNTVKIIHNREYAHWFCRASLSYGDHHLGVYGYRPSAFEKYVNSKKYIEEEKEQLEQLRWIQNDVIIGVTEVDFDGIEINTPEDLNEWHRRNGK